MIYIASAHLSIRFHIINNFRQLLPCPHQHNITKWAKEDGLTRTTSV